MDKFEQRRVALQALVGSLGRGGIAKVAAALTRDRLANAVCKYLDGLLSDEDLESAIEDPINDLRRRQESHNAKVRSAHLNAALNPYD